MSERSAEEIRLEIAAERQRLVEDIADLRGEARSLVPVAIALFAVAVVVRSKTPGRAARLLWRLR
jgi:hypothetical protein